jgi:hypothetical protein
MAWWGWLLTALGAWLALSAVVLTAFAVGAAVGRGRAVLALLRADDVRFLDTHRWN